MISTADELLAALEDLPHAARLRRTAVTAHRLAARGALRPLLTALDALGTHERRLAALAALTGGETDYLAARLGDPDPVVRRYALRGARRLPVADAAVEAAYDDAPAVVRADLARLLRDGRGAALAERLVPRVRAEYGDRDAARLLPGCSAAFTARLLPELAGALAFEDWSTLAVRHPAAVLDQLERELGGLPERLRDTWWGRHATGIAAALPAAPARVLDLLERYGPDDLPGPVHDRLGHLVAVDAERVTRWLADPGRAAARWERTPGRAVLRQLVTADPPSLPRLGARWFHRGAFGILLRSMVPARRPAFLDAVVSVADPRRNVRAHEGVLALLPAAERHARACAAVDALRAERRSGWDLWGLLALLPPAEARAGLLAALGTGDAEDRGALWCRLATGAGLTRDPHQVAEVLALAADRLANERDPVREEALSAFADLPAPLLAAALGPDVSAGARPGRSPLERLCLAALASRDCSPGTRNAVRALAVKLLATAAGRTPAGEAVAEDDTDRTLGDAATRTAVRLVEALTAHTATVDLGRLDGTLDAGGMRAVVHALGPWLDRAAARGDVAPLLALVTSCGRHAHRVPELQDRLEQAVRTCPDALFGEVAAAWLADPATRGDRVAHLLEREPSAVFVPQVLAVLAAQRTDLLDPALTDVPHPDGRFPAPGTPRPLPPFRHADRWLPRQREAAVRLAAAAVADPGRSLDERAALLRAAASVPEHGRYLLRQYTAVPPATTEPDDTATLPADHVDSALTRAALDAAAHTDDPASALAALLDHAGDDRAVAAWSAAARAAAHARPSRVAALLRDVLHRESGVKVTVRKAAARLAARHLPPAAAAELLATVGRSPGVHPDVHATVVALAATLLPDDDMWTLLDAAVSDGPVAARRALLDVDPADLAPPHRARYGELVARLPFVTDEQVADEAVYHLRDWAQYTPAAGAALAHVCTDLASPLSLWRASHGLAELAQSGLPHPTGGAAPGSLLHDVVDRLLALIAAGEPEGGAHGTDLPARRRLEAVLGSSVRDPRVCAALARRLAAEPAVTFLRSDLLVRALDLGTDERALLLSLRELTEAIEGRPVLAARVAEDLTEAHRYGPPLADPAPAVAAIGALSADGGVVTGLLAVGLVTALGVRQNWPQSCRTAVVALRRHPERDVREAAYATVLG
ncbi:hypothetical protein [Streptomyces glaucescens]|uniref:Uncharacterized protein n=1 Tax=Streptomyces glaucescens TaxID=1907 RepID=A0A089XLU4_STRGA|nr:hypothetical protein [Streptomyces glaucescens]AIS02210.1 hypothetical protein SGLAU_31380 [Streptomyces glaucescens]